MKQEKSKRNKINISANESGIDPKQVYKSFKEDKIGNSNCIIDLLKELQGSDIKKIRTSVGALHKIFCLLIKDGDIKEIIGDNLQNPKDKYNSWLYERYLEVHEHHLKMVSNKEIPLQLRDMAVLFIMKLIQKESLYPVTKEKIGQISFPIQRLTDLYKTLLTSEKASFLIDKRLKDTLQSPDFLFVSLYVLADIVKNSNETKMPPSYHENLINILQLVQLPEEGKKPLKSPTLFIVEKEGQDEAEEENPDERFAFPHKEAKQLFNEVWEAALHLHFTPAMYTRCLILLPNVMKHLHHPVRLTDFFMNAYNIGGVHSLLAMHGVYILVTQYNLEYPDFYEKVYALFTQEIFLAKYRTRFFKLCDKFFLSPYIPEYIAASVIKRCCRLILIAPSPCLILLVKFIANMLLRFPSLTHLINNPNAASVEDDPFVADEPNLLHTRATESSLWELETLRSHPLCGVSKAASFISRNLPDVEHDLSKFCAVSYESLYQKAKKIKEPRVATTFYKPEGLFKYSDDTMSSAWDVI